MATKINNLEKLIGSGIYSGYFPYFSGTAGSMVALAIYLIPGFENPVVMLLLISFFILTGQKLALKFEKRYGIDPKEFTLDEFIGTWISLLFIPKIIWYILPAFILWRLFDILKPYPIKKLEKVGNGWGVLLDDIAAGFYTFFLVHILFYFFN
ncbi:phosphatidylglycerophosphatase A [Melioribacter roseus P3M-2]|uniref:Phosphatidylglycerophosphatase A n=1 Tax=Melioribacter roseus (strain DSM 23840 / JCM 17771 / VKM B-2668 / P3M-2) TaxID=1191523 RepID=I7A375_MELRP|nr:phosphatidylglycerophosphatase A [Melioribacter roseus]AFN75663.1 phosphatidylglycerophosphatase A [Melioribacter roseus P3M-2]